MGSGPARPGAEARAAVGGAAAAAAAAAGAEAAAGPKVGVAEAAKPPLGLALAAVHAVDFVGVLELLSESLCVIEYRLKGNPNP